MRHDIHPTVGPPHHTTGTQTVAATPAPPQRQIPPVLMDRLTVIDADGDTQDVQLDERVMTMHPHALDPEIWELQTHEYIQRYELALRRLHQVRAACHHHSGRVVSRLRDENADLRAELEHVKGELATATQVLGAFQAVSTGHSPGIGGSTTQAGGSRSRPQGLSPPSRNVRRRSDSSSQDTPRLDDDRD
ncbi:hypothetical protein ACHQM5_014505 [Ranunculus cassubicifolius]